MLLQAPDRVRQAGRPQPGARPAPCPWTSRAGQLFSGAAGNPGNRAAIIDFTTGSKLTTTFIDQVVRHSLENSTEAAFAAYLQMWAKEDFSATRSSPDTARRSR